MRGRKKGCIIVLFLAALIGVLGLGGLLVWLLRPAQLPEPSAAGFSDGNFRILFALDARGPAGDGSIFDIYSIISDGSKLRHVRRELSMVWAPKAEAVSFHPDTASSAGNALSPDGTKKLIAQPGFIPILVRSRILLEENGNRRAIYQGDFGEMQWLPDSRRVVFLSVDGICILDTVTGKYARLADGAGWIMVEEAGNK